MKFNILIDFLELLKECHKLFVRNGKAMSSLTLLFIFVTSIQLVIYMYYLQPPVDDLTIKGSLLAAASPTGDEFADLITSVMYDIMVFLGVELIFILGNSFTSLFFATASILASAVSYCGKDLSIKELLPRALKSLKRPFVTWFYIYLLNILYICVLLAILLPLVLIFHIKLNMSAFTIAACILAVVFQTYLVVVWNLALVVSTLEEKYGMEALRKAGQLIKGSRLRGFFLNLVLATSLWLFYQIVGRPMLVKAQIIRFLLLNCIGCLITMVSRMAYTVLYYESKATYGEKLGLQGSLDAKVTSATPLINEDVV